MHQQGVVGLAGAFHRDVVAEGVELPADSSAAPGMTRLNKPVEAPMEAFWVFDLSTLLLDLVDAVVLSVILTVIANTLR